MTLINNAILATFLDKDTTFLPSDYEFRGSVLLRFSQDSTNYGPRLRKKSRHQLKLLIVIHFGMSFRAFNTLPEGKILKAKIHRLSTNLGAFSPLQLPFTQATTCCRFQGHNEIPRTVTTKLCTCHWRLMYVERVGNFKCWWPVKVVKKYKLNRNGSVLIPFNFFISKQGFSKTKFKKLIN